MAPPQTLALSIVGATGRMGRQVIQAALTTPGFRVVGGVVRPGSPARGTDLGVLAGREPCGALATDDLAAALRPADVVVDFSVPAVTVQAVEAARALGKPIVIGTTGLSPADLDRVRQASQAIPVLLAPNMSVGVNLLLKVLPAIVQALGPGYDIEIIEAHHRHKRDAPSGTALKLAEAIAQAAGQTAPRLVHGRQGLSPRQPGEIGVHAVRAGGIVGEHTVLFASEGEEVALVHRAYSRQTFAEGALRAARFLADKPPGLYSMLDVLAG
jgi:4-hydroxy-tetrahydrodipicolinate reductase